MGTGLPMSGPKLVFPEPQALKTNAPKLPGTDGRKMSKSYGNTILLTDPEPVVRQKLKTMVTDPARVRRTDPGNPDVCPVGDLHKIFSDAETNAKVDVGCRSAGIGCIECKGWAADSLMRVLSPMQERRKKYEQNPRLAWAILESGSERARQAASPQPGTATLSATPTSAQPTASPTRIATAAPLATPTAAPTNAQGAK